MAFIWSVDSFYTTRHMSEYIVFGMASVSVVSQSSQPYSTVLLGWK